MSILRQVQDRVGKLKDYVNKIIQLDLSGIQIKDFSPDVKTYLQKFQSLEVLQLNDCGLTSLANLPIIPSLIQLDLSNNQFDPKELRHLFRLTKLEEIALANNKLSQLEDLRSLSSLKLKQLDLEGNAATELQNYRQKVFGMFTELQALDGKDKDGNQLLYEDQEQGSQVENEEDQEYDGEEDDEDNDDDYSESLQSQQQPKKRRK